MVIAGHANASGHAGHSIIQSAMSADIGAAVLAALVHALAMMLVSMAVALVVYKVVGLKILRSAWINLDRVWALTFVGVGVFVWVQ